MPELRIGSINAASPTPLKPDGALDVASARRLCNYWLEIGLDGVFVIGSMGEGLWLSESTRNAFVELVLDEVGDRLTIMVSAMSRSAGEMAERAARHAAMGAHCVILSAPVGSSADQAVADAVRIAEACDVPCGYYEVPLVTGVPLTFAQLREVLAHPNMRVLKNSSGNALLSQCVTAPSPPWGEVAVLDGVEYQAAYSALLGYDGYVHGGGVLSARRIRRIWELVQAGAIREALELDRQNSLFLGTVYNRLAGPVQNIIGQKYALKLMGIFDHETVLVDQQLDDASRRRITDAVKSIAQ